MTQDKLLVAAIGVFGIVFTYWFFLLKKDKAVEADGKIKIIVDGGYNPDIISIRKDKTTTFTFLRKDANTCLEDVVLSEFKIKKFLPLNKEVEIQIHPTKSGIFPFSCGMGMFHGKLIVK